MAFLVTGGSRGIGKAIVLDAARSGHDVAFTYATQPESAAEVVSEAQQAAPNSKVKAYKLDVRDSSSVDTTVEEIAEDFESIDVLINNAGVQRMINLKKGTKDLLKGENEIETNLVAPINLAAYFIPWF